MMRQFRNEEQMFLVDKDKDSPLQEQSHRILKYTYLMILFLHLITRQMQVFVKI